jgi:hypothetical protein
MTFVQDGSPGDGIETPSIEEVEAALRNVPDDLSWDWASRRLIPIFERGYEEGVNGDPMVNTLSHLGVGIGFGIDFGPAFGRVTRSMAQRWEASTEQIQRAAFSYLARTAATVSSSDLQTVVHQGHLFRALGSPAGWASSIILAGSEELVRIFGTRNAFFTAPTRGSLLAFGPGTPARVVAQLTVELESMDPHPLLLDPFAFHDGALHWEGEDDSLDEAL